MLTTPPPSIADPFGRRAEWQASVGREPDAAARPTIFELFGAGVQRRATGAEHDTEQIHASAQRGVVTAAEPLPHAEQIQRLFGRHDVSAIQAHTGTEAAASADAMGATAYATGNHVVFGGAPDLFTAAHEAAHVVQQRHGVSLRRGIDEGRGDPHEAHADAVAAQVVRGEPVELLLDQYTGAGGDGARESSSSSSIKRLFGTPIQRSSRGGGRGGRGRGGRGRGGRGRGGRGTGDRGGRNGGGRDGGKSDGGNDGSNKTNPDLSSNQNQVSLIQSLRRIGEVCDNTKGQLAELNRWFEEHASELTPEEDKQKKGSDARIVKAFPSTYKLATELFKLFDNNQSLPSETLSEFNAGYDEVTSALADLRKLQLAAKDRIAERASRELDDIIAREVEQQREQRAMQEAKRAATQENRLKQQQKKKLAAKTNHIEKAEAARVKEAESTREQQVQSLREAENDGPAQAKALEERFDKEADIRNGQKQLRKAEAAITAGFELLSGWPMKHGTEQFDALAAQEEEIKQLDSDVTGRIHEASSLIDGLDSAWDGQERWETTQRLADQLAQRKKRLNEVAAKIAHARQISVIRRRLTECLCALGFEVGANTFSCFETTAISTSLGSLIWHITINKTDLDAAAASLLSPSATCASAVFRVFHITPEVLAIAQAKKVALGKLDSNPHLYCTFAGTTVKQEGLSLDPANAWNQWMQLIAELDSATLLGLTDALVKDLAVRLDEKWNQ